MMIFNFNLLQKKKRLRWKLQLGLLLILITCISTIMVWYQIIWNCQSCLHKPPQDGVQIYNFNTISLILPPPHPVADDLQSLSAQLQAHNALQPILNLDKFGPLTPSSTSVVIQVHDRLQYLSNLIQSLSRTSYIADSLLIFSHDLYDPSINSLISSINFTRVLQIFYPHSIQLHPTSFPGQSPTDCPRDARKEAALHVLNCTNAATPDAYGHYREAKFTQIKHHWWWKLNFIFKHVEVLENYSRPVLFIEEDHYLAPNSLDGLKLLEDPMGNANVDLLCLGSYNNNVRPSSNSNIALVTNWISTKHNMELALNRSLWSRLVMDCGLRFCSYDDYNWDWSLMEISLHCMKEPLRVVLFEEPRIFHIGHCGIHHKKQGDEGSKAHNCDPEVVVEAINARYDAVVNNNGTSPALVIKDDTNHNKNVVIKANGGWGDPRDHKLCLSFTTT